MKLARKLRVVPDCPQPDPPPYKPVQYGFAGGHKIERLAASPLPHEANIIARVQSMRCRDGKRAEPLSFEASLTYLRNVERVRKHRVTVPRPLSDQCQSVPRQRTTPPPVAPWRAGSITPAFDDEAGWDEYIRSAMAGEFQPF